jgi:hypothetical protein
MIKIANAVAFELIFQEHWNDETYDNEVTGIVALGVNYSAPRSIATVKMIGMKN